MRTIIPQNIAMITHNMHVQGACDSKVCRSFITDWAKIEDALFVMQLCLRILTELRFSNSSYQPIIIIRRKSAFPS